MQKIYNCFLVLEVIIMFGMSVLGSASRFAVLKLEDDEPVSTKLVKNPSEVQAETKTNENKPKGKKKKKKSTQDDANELQSMAFGAPKSKSKSSQQKLSRQSHQGSDKQWEEWKKKDAEFVSEAYEQDLEQALLLSKIDFEEKKEFYNCVQKEAEQSKSGNSNHKKKKISQKKDKPVPMTLEDFQNLSPTETSISKKETNLVQEKSVIVPDEKDFFNKLEEDVEKIINLEQRKDSYQRVQTYKDDQLRNIQYKDELEQKDKEIEKLKEEVKKYKTESKTLKDRIKLMSKLLFEGEMQDKAKILVQVDKLTEVKDELTEQVAELHAALEQERSKVHTLTTELKKFQSKKKEAK